jgi:hypothetical protein
MHSSNLNLRVARGLLACVMIVCAGSRVAHAQQGSEGSPQAKRVQGLSDVLRKKLKIAQSVEVTIVAANRLLMSVEPVGNGSHGEFRLLVEEGFAQGLSDAELTAAVAHELGHVWIFTHHPFLQTEQLANDIAMRLVTREALTRLYERVWSRRGTKGDLARFLGPDPQPASEALSR